MTEATISSGTDPILYAVPKSVEDAYAIVLDVANRVLRQCTTFSIESLREENPTIGEIARSMRVICQLMHSLAECNELGVDWTTHKAHEYVDHIQAMANAIDAGDEGELNRQCELLNGRNFL